jgi:hypothetical protein
MTIMQLTNEVCGVSLQNHIRQASTELASVQAGCKINSLFRPSVVDCETGKHGIRWLIARILSENNAILPVYAGNFRNVYLNIGMTTDSICAKVRQINGFDKYPDKTIIHNLSEVMTKSGQVSSLKMTASEDVTRTSKRPRKLWYLVQN